MQEAVKSDIPGIDIMKFLMAFAVVVIHFTAMFVPDKNDIPSVVQWTMRCAVPFYFIATGYLTSGISGDKTAMAKRGLRFLKVWALWTLIYLPAQFFTGFDPWNDIRSFVYSLLYNGEVGFLWPLWYVYAMALFFIIESYSVNRPCVRRIVRILYCVGFITYSYNLFNPDSVFAEISHWFPERIFYGCQIILLGYYMSLWTEKGSGKLFVALAVMFLLSIVLFISGLPFWDTVGGAAFFVLALALKLRPRDIYLTMRRESIWIYYIHMYILVLIMMFGKSLELDLAQSIALTFASTFILSWLLTYLQKHGKVLSFLIS